MEKVTCKVTKVIEPTKENESIPPSFDYQFKKHEGVVISGEYCGSSYPREYMCISDELMPMLVTSKIIKPIPVGTEFAVSPPPYPRNK